MDLQDALKEAKRILESSADAANEAIGRGDLAEAKRLVTGGQRDLRELKRTVANDERELKASFQGQRNKINNSGQVIGLFGGSKMRGAMSRGRAMDKRRLADQQLRATDAYRSVKATIDDFVNQLGDAKFKIDSVAKQTAKPRASAAKAPAKAKTEEPDAIEQLKKLGELRDAGVVSEAEFEAKKTELLRRI